MEPTSFAALALSSLAAATGSIVVDSRWADSVEIEGVGCGLPASATVSLPPTASDVQVRRPKIGATTLDSRLTEVAVIGPSVRLTAVGAGEDVCDPTIEDTPPAQRPWSGFYPWDFSFRERVTVAYWRGSGKPRTKPPRKVTIPGVAHAVKVRWRKWGGRKAIGFGRIKTIPPPGVKCNYYTCPGHKMKVKVVAAKPSRCPDIGGTVYYGRISFYAAQRARFMKKGDLYTYFHPGCQSAKPKPV
jgi:hypothetical protein